MLICGDVMCPGRFEEGIELLLGTVLLRWGAHRYSTRQSTALQDNAQAARPLLESTFATFQDVAYLLSNAWVLKRTAIIGN